MNDSPAGQKGYLYGAVHKQGLTVDFLLSERRDIAAAKLFFTQAIRQHGPPQRITPDGYPATHAALGELKAEEVPPQQTKVTTSKYLNEAYLQLRLLNSRPSRRTPSRDDIQKKSTKPLKLFGILEEKYFSEIRRAFKKINTT